MLSQKALHTVVCMLWMLWLLVLQPGLAAATQHQDQQQQHATGSSVTRNMQQAQLMRALLADTKLYCNITSGFDAASCVRQLAFTPALIQHCTVAEPMGCYQCTALHRVPRLLRTLVSLPGTPFTVKSTCA
jgi:hypothetical protein